MNLRIVNDEHSLKQIESLRQKLLRDPIGLTFSKEQLNNERRTDMYVAAFDTNVLVGSLQLRREQDCQFMYRVRQVVVDDRCQGKGIGRDLMHFAHDYVSMQGKEKGESKVMVVLDARVHIVPFYKKLGYQISGDPFILVGIEHYPMIKTLLINNS